MTGTSSAERLKITTAGDFQIVNGNSFTYNGNTVLHAGNVSTYAFAKSGSWAADLVSSYGYTRETGMQMTGGSEFVVLSKSGQGYLLVDGSYLTGEAGGFYSSNNSSGGTLLGFYSDTTTSLNFNTTSVKLNGNQILHAGNYTSYAVGLGSNNTLTGTNVQNSPNNTFINTVTNANQSLTIYQGTAGADAYLTFHIGGDFAAYFGLGGAENDLVYGGWSVGNFRYRILHSGNQSFAWNLNQNLRTTDSPTFSELSLSGVGTSAYNILKYGGTRSGDWQSFTNLAGQINVIQVENISAGGHTNYPTGVYTYGGVMSWRLSSHSFQLYAAHTGDLAYKTQWGNDNYSGWRRILDSTNYSYAANMNQNVRSSDSPTFVDVSTTGNLQIRNASPTITLRDTNNRTGFIHVNSDIFYVLTGAADSGNGSWGTVANGRWPMELNLATNNATFGGDVNAITYTLTGGFQISHPGSGYGAFNNWVLLGTTGFYSSTNSAHIYPNTGSYGSWRMDGSRGGWAGLEFGSGVSLMANSNQVGFHRNGYGWQMWWSAGTGYIHKGNPGGGTQATILESSNYNSYAPTLTGTGASGTWSINITGSSTSCTGNAASATYAPEVSLTGLGTSTVNVNNPRTAVYRNENGAGAALAYAPVLHLGGGDTMWQIQGTYGSSGNGTLYFRQGYNGSWGTWLTMLSSANYNSYSPTLTGTGASGSWGINITGSSASCTGNAATATLATKASTLSQGGGNGTAMTFNWSGQSGQPTWLWGSNDGTNIYVWNPSNFNVNSAASVTGTVAIGNGGTGATTATNARTNLGIDARIRAWCHFDGTPPSATTLNANFNVSSVTKNGTGDYTVNFTSAIGNTTYVVAGTAQLDAPSPGQSNYNVFVAVPRRSGAQASGSCRVVSEYPAGVALYDSVIFRVAFIAA